LAEAVTPEQVFEAVVDQVALAIDASSAGLFSLEDESSTVHLIRHLGYGEAAARALKDVALDAAPSFPALDTIRTGTACWFDTQAQLLERYPHLTSFVTPTRSYRAASIPVHFERKVRAALAFTFEGPPAIDSELRSFLLLIARYCGQALERLHLLEAERKSRQAAEAAALRAGVSSRVSRLLVDAAWRR
jgi:GAF domain-containing protein